MTFIARYFNAQIQSCYKLNHHFIIQIVRTFQCSFVSCFEIYSRAIRIRTNDVVETSRNEDYRLSVTHRKQDTSLSIVDKSGLCSRVPSCSLHEHEMAQWRLYAAWTVPDARRSIRFVGARRGRRKRRSEKTLTLRETEAYF